jgi:hypothetical protein
VSLAAARLPRDHPPSAGGASSSAPGGGSRGPLALKPGAPGCPAREKSTPRSMGPARSPSGIADAVHFFNPVAGLVVVGWQRRPSSGTTWIAELRRARPPPACFVVEAAAACRFEGGPRPATDCQRRSAAALAAAGVARYRRARDDEAVDVNRPPET